MTTVEATLTRKFNIGFSDARSIVTEARLNLDIMGYPNREQKELLVTEASKIFETLSQEKRESMQSYQTCLEYAKLNGSQSSSSLDLSSRRNGDSNHNMMSFGSTHSTASTKSMASYILNRQS